MPNLIILLLTAVLAPIATGQSVQATESGYFPNEIIVKFHETIAETVEKQLEFNTLARGLKLSTNLDELNTKYRVKKIKPLFKNFKKNRQRVKTLLKKDNTLLTKREKRILRRFRRAPKGAKVPDLDRIYKIEVQLKPGQSLEEAVAAYNSDPDVEYAELNYIVSVNLTPNDPLYSIQWPLNNTGQMYPEGPWYNLAPGTLDCDIDAPEAWNVNIGSLEVIIAVVDTGVDYNHRDLQDNRWVNQEELEGEPNVDDDENGYTDDIYGYDFCNDDGDPIDDKYHGTHCSGIIAAQGDNGLDITGVCWNARIMALKFLDSSGHGSKSDAAEAFYYAVENGADVTSNSWGADDYFEPLKEAIDYAHSQGVIMVAAAGNENSDDPHYPAYYENMIAVAATDSHDERARFSSYGDWVDIAAPGVDILSLRASGTSGGTPYDDYTTIASGTSMACPHVAGVAALIISNYPEISSELVEARLFATTDDISDENPDYEGLLGKGRLNAYKATRKTYPGSITLDRDSYSCSDVMAVEVQDIDLFGEELRQVAVTTDGGDEETVTLIADYNEPWIFTDTICTSPNSVIIGDGTLQVSHGQIITATYEDANDGTGNPATVYATATVDCQAPEILSVEVVDIACTGGWVILKTDEPTTSRVRCGLVCGGPWAIIAEDTMLSVHHNIYLSGLAYETQYYFEIEAIDAVGNDTTEPSGGQCYTFTTTPKPPGLHVPSEYPTIQDAIDAAIDGNTIWIADGTYTGVGNRDIDFEQKAIILRSEMGPENCIIDCNSTESSFHYGFKFDSGEGPDSVVAGVTITNCSGVPKEIDGFHTTVGGALLCDNSSPNISHCFITGNSAGFGGGICCLGNSSPMISHCIITGNWAHWNFTEMIGGIGGGICSLQNSTPTITNCTITGNLADVSGGGGGCQDSNAVIANCILWGNTADLEGPEVSLVSHGYPSVITISYSDIQGGEAGVYVDPCCILNWELSNMNVDPCFVEPGYWDDNGAPEKQDDIWVDGNYHLQSQAGRWDLNQTEWVTDANTSPCIDAGDPASAWAGELWPHGKRINMGAYGGTPQASMSLSDLGNIADIDTNDVVDYIDLKLFTNKWLYQEILRPEDLDRNGFVNYADFAIFANNWFWEE